MNDFDVQHELRGAVRQLAVAAGRHATTGNLTDPEFHAALSAASDAIGALLFFANTDFEEDDA